MLTDNLVNSVNVKISPVFRGKDNYIYIFNFKKLVNLEGIKRKTSGAIYIYQFL